MLYEHSKSLPGTSFYIVYNSDHKCGKWRTFCCVKILYISGRMTEATRGICRSVTSRQNSTNTHMP